MSELFLDRVVKEKHSTIGVLSLDDTPLCWTLEDAVRQQKIFANTAIPDGRYQIIPHEWKGVIVPKLLKVPFFEGILIHVGNDDIDTHGCILVGYKATFKYLEVSRGAFRDLMEKVYPLFEKDEFFITIKGGLPPNDWIQSEHG
jgi:hypothetical protein